MSASVVEALKPDLLEWLAAGEKTYEEAIDAWRTSCPKLRSGKMQMNRGLIARENVSGREVVGITSLGIALVDRLE